MYTVKLRITFTEELLGTASANPELYKEFIASKREDNGGTSDEVAALPSVEEEVQKSMTVFTRDAEGNPTLWDYQIKGFFKDACGSLSRFGEKKTKDGERSESSKITAYRKVIDGLIFVKPRQITLHLPEGGKIGTCERPLRAQTAQGERVALAKSETVPAGTWFECEVILIDPKYDGTLEEWLQYGSLRGIGQWRNSGKGRFEFKRLK